MDHHLTSRWVIELTSEHPTAQLAAQELRRAIQRMGGPALTITGHANDRRLALRHGTDGDGFVRIADERGLTLIGEGPRGLLYAVYHLLETLGWRWVGPGPADEYVPRPSTITLPTTTVAEQPAFTRRGLVIGHDLFLTQGEAWIEWAARVRLNTIFIHTIADHGMPLGACRQRTWQSHRNRLWPLIHTRGLRLEIGGHHLTAAIPRRLFRQQPDLFRYDGRRRVANGNPCPTNPATQALVYAWAKQWFCAEPAAEVYHLWPDDRLAGGWCACPQCAGLSPADQSLLLVNVMAKALAETNPHARLAYLAYHDTFVPPQQMTPAANVELLIAPRRRSYAVGIGDSTHPINGPLADDITALRTTFPTGAGVFEYYLDGILFKSTLPPLGEIIAADLRAYHKWRLDGVYVLLTGDRPWLAPGPNPYSFAALAWNPQRDPIALRREYAAVRAPTTATLLDCAYAELTTAWQRALNVTPAEVQRQQLGLTRDPITQPPRDLLDGYDAPPPHCEQRLVALHDALDTLHAGETALAAARRSAHAEQAALAGDIAEWTASALVLRYFAARQEAAVVQARRAPPARQRQAIVTARATYAELLDWATRYVPLSARAGHRLLRAIFALHLDHLESRIAPPWRRLYLRWQRFGELVRLLAQLWWDWHTKP
ncbi:MAG: DUF4838 domain-containing protein [Chloroflexus sp.]|uniref:DUF4838 domain-containing protein n=1 Tax=Chloroflexus sp. TaxID=1904827 RepID=UPI0021DC6058|nr:DUF4838 domain-containing protein [Chloroflexus sp.]GIV87925.1 MAG: DUF4838 domain-containing protein [Chloroflexus sp.]